MTGWGMVRSYILRHRFVYLAGVTLVALASMLAAVIPRLVGRVTDRLQHGTLGVREMAGFCAVIIAVSAFRVTCGWTGRILVHRKGRLFTYEIRNRLLQKWSTLSPSYYHRHSVGDLVSHALSDVEAVRELVSQGINVSLSGVSMLLSTLYMMALYVNWRLTVVGLGPLVAIPFLVKWLGPKIRLQSQRSQEALGGMAQTVEEVIGGIRAVKAFGTEKVVIGRFEAKVDAIFGEKMRLVLLSALFSSLIPLMANLGFVMVLGYGGYLVTEKIITLGDFVAFTLYVAMLRMPLEQLGNVMNIIQRSGASLTRIAEMLQVVPEVVDREEPLFDLPLKGGIEVRGLSFSYPENDREILSDISFTVQPGQTLGIIGGMGSGKTTLADLLLRLYDPPAASVFLDGRDILRYPLARLREGIAYVPQDGFLFSTSIAENIGFSDKTPDLSRATSCARITAVHDNIVNFPDGYATEVGERGVRLSGGQKQRLAIARMIYKDAPVQIMDDSLSAVDTRTERLILENLKELGSAPDGSAGRRKSTIVISHRLSAVQHADEILVLEEGRIVERGSHAALIALRGRYARQWQMQSGVAEDGSPSGPGGGYPGAGLADLAGEVASGLSEDAA